MARKLKALPLLCFFLTAIVAIGPAEADRYPHLTFAKAVETSSVIVRGFLVGAFDGRTIRSAAIASSSAGMRTVFLKIAPLNVLKGNGEDYFLVEVRKTTAVIDELMAGRYRDEVLLVLSPASNWLLSPEITLSPGARAEWALEKPLYEPTTPALLFAMTGTGRVVAPLDRSRMLDDLYANFDSIAALESHFAAIQADEPRQGGETAGGFRDWGETGPVERVETQYADSPQ